MATLLSVMIDLCQWRASIGLWNCCKWPCCTGNSSTLKGGWVLGRSKEKKKKPTFSLILFLSVLLILAGDVELNPGPVTGNHIENLSLIYISILFVTNRHQFNHKSVIESA